MGNKLEVYSWVIKNGYTGNSDNDYEYKLIYAGESFMDAMCAFFNEKKKGVGCVKLEWR